MSCQHREDDFRESWRRSSPVQYRENLCLVSDLLDPRREGVERRVAEGWRHDGQHCLEKVQTTREKEEEDSPQEKTMPCRHTEDVCQRCLQKVQTTTEDSPPPKRVVPPLKKPKARQNSIFVDTYFLVIQVAITYFAAKNFMKAFTQ